MPQPIKVPLGALKMVPLDELTPDETPSRPEATSHIGPVTGQDNAPVTLGDLIDNPSLAIKRMIHLTKEAVTDPRVMIPAALGLGAGALMRAADVAPSMPKMPDVRGAVLRGAQRVTGGLNPEVAADAVGVLSPRAGNAIRTAGRVVKVLTPKPPAEAAPAPVSTPGAAPPPTPTAPPAPTVSAAPPAESAPSEGAMPSLAELQLTPAEITTAVKWHESGVSPETILHRILQSRQLTAKTRTTTPDQAAEAVRYRNAHGRWQDEQ